MRWWLLAAGAAVLAIMAAVVLLRPAQSRPPGPLATRPPPFPSPSSSGDAGCPALTVASKGPAPSTSLTLEADQSVSLSVDRFPFSGGARVLPGRHVFEARAAGVEPLLLPLELEAFRPVVLEVRAEGSHLVAVVAGAHAPGCVGLVPDPGLVAGEAPSVDATATALAKGDCRAAFEHLRAWPEARRPARLAQAAFSLTGQWPRGLPTPSVERLAERQRPTEAALERAWLVARWNGLTEQLSHATAQLAGRATGVVTAANERMGTLSDDFSQATEREDTPTQRALVEAATLALRRFADNAVALHPTDCAWQATVQAALQ